MSIIAYAIVQTIPLEKLEINFKTEERPCTNFLD